MAENNQAMHDYFSAKEKAAVEKKSTDSPPDRSALSLAALVAEFFERCGKVISRESCFDDEGENYKSINIDGVQLIDHDNAANGVCIYIGGCSVTPWENDGFVGCKIADLDRFPGVRNALVGAVLAWLKKNMGGDLYSRCIMIHSLGEVTVCDELDEEPTGGDEEMGATHITREYESDRDELRALLLAALAVADQKEAKG